MSAETTLPLEIVKIDNGLNPREGALDQDAVREYSQVLADLPPMQVFEVPGEGYLLVAGFHRFAAHELAGVEDGRFVVHYGSRDEAAEFADLDNLKHGIRLTRREKRQVIERQLKRHPEWADVRLAHACHSTDKTVRSVRQELEETSEIPTLDRLVGSDGVERPRSVERPQPVPVELEAEPELEAPPPPPAKSAPPVADEGETDWLTKPEGEPESAAEAAPPPPPPPPPAPRPQMAALPNVQITITIRPGEALAERDCLVSVQHGLGSNGASNNGSYATKYGNLNDILAQIETEHLQEVN